MLSFPTILAIAFSLSADAFFTAMSAAAGPPNPRQTFRLSFHFGLFQAIMPVFGWFGGRSVAGFMAGVDHWLASGILAAIALHMLWEGFHPDEEKPTTDRSRGLTLIALSVATSIDAFAVGLTFGVIGQTIAWPATVIGVVTGLVTWLGVHLGRHIKRRVGAYAEIIGGLLLLVIAYRMTSI